MILCGTKSFLNVDAGDQQPRSRSTPSSPASRTRRPDRNPYSTLGLDKFAAVLAELDSLKQTVAAESGPLDTSSIRFTFADSHWVPIILHKDPNHTKNDPNQRYPNETMAQIPTPRRQVEKRRCCEGRGGCREGRRKRCSPSYYWLLAMVVVLACLALSGRALAICCTCGWWFVVGKFRGGGGGGCKARKGSYVYMRRLSEKNLWGGGGERRLSSCSSR